MPAASNNSVPRLAAIAAAIAGVVNTLIFQYKVAHHSTSLLLPLMFAVWGTAPFAALLWFNLSSSAWPAALRNRLHFISILLCAATLAIYASASGSLRFRPAAPFLMVPIGCWIVIVAARLIATRRVTS
jgi:hypothetical protein